MSQVALRLPDSLYRFAKQLAAQDSVSLNRFILTSVAEKIQVLNTEAFFQQRAAFSTRENLTGFLPKWLTVHPSPVMKSSAAWRSSPRLV
jgi:hypothetical protein